MRLGRARRKPRRRAMDERIKFFVGLDVHKDTISIAGFHDG
jgi:hypothetical protein